MKSPPPSAIEQTRVQALKEFRSVLHEALASAIADEGVPDAFKEAINWDKLIDQTETRLVEVWQQRFDAQGKLAKTAMGPLSLLRDDEHEQQVLSEMFVNEVSYKDRERLEQLQQLLAAIGVEGWQSPSENPLGPSVWVDGVRSGMQHFQCTPEERSWLLQRLMPLLMARMGNFYGTLNSRISNITGVPLSSLSGRRVMAPPPPPTQAGEEFGHDLVENTSASRQATAAALQAESEDGGTDVLERLFSLMGAQRMGAYATPGMAQPGGGVWPGPAAVPGMYAAPAYGYPQQAGQYPMGQYSGMPAGAPVAPAPMWSDADLRSVLALLQNSYVAAPGSGQAMMPGGSTARLFEAVNQTASQIGLAGGLQSMPGPAHDMMELVNMLFEALLDGRRLDERARSQLARLVIPYVRVALLDRRMFMQSRHPARRVLNLLVEALETAASDAPQFRDLREIAFAAIERILEEFKDDLAIFETLDKSLSEALSERRRGAEIAERRMADAERGRERRSIAMATVTAQLQQAIGGARLPEPVRQFLTGPWQHHQTILILREGADGDHVQANLGLLIALTRACRRGGTTDLKRLRTGVESILASSGQSAEDVEALLAELASAIAEQSGDDAPAAAAPVESVPLPTVPEIARNAESVPAEISHDDAEVEARLLAEIANFVADADAIRTGDFVSPDAQQSEAIVAEPIVADRVTESERDPDPDSHADAFDMSAPETLAPTPLPVVQAPELDADLLERYRKLQVGDWLDLVNEDGRITAARISWTSPISGRHMLSNRRGQRLMVASVEELAAMELEGQVHIRSNDAAFDVALNALADRLARTAGVVAPK
jgi:hypothetical protein